MSDTQAAVSGPDGLESRADGRRRVPGRRIAVAAVALLLIVGVGWFAWWWTHPSLFGPGGNGVGFGPLPVGDSVNMAITSPGDPDGVGGVTIEKVGANVVENSAAATMSFAVCAVDPEHGVVGVDTGKPADLCLGVRSASDVQLANDEYVLLTVTPTKAGVVRIRNFDFTYRHGREQLFQHGTETTGQRVKVTSR